MKRKGGQKKGLSRLKWIKSQRLILNYDHYQNFYHYSNRS